MERVQGFLDKPAPQTILEVKSFHGFVSFYRKFIKNFSQIAAPLIRLFKKDAKFVWNQEQIEAYEYLREKLKEVPILAHFDPTKRVELRTDASTQGIGAHLVQYDDENKPHLLACLSRTLSAAEKNYSVSELECLAIVVGITKFRPYLYGRQFEVVTDHHGLCFLTKTKDLAGRLARWSIKLMDYNFTIKYK